MSYLCMISTHNHSIAVSSASSPISMDISYVVMLESLVIIYIIRWQQLQHDRWICVPKGLVAFLHSHRKRIEEEAQRQLERHLFQMFEQVGQLVAFCVIR